MGILIYFGALWLAISALTGAGIVTDWIWAILLPATWAALLPLLKN